MRNINVTQRLALTMIVGAWPGSYGAPSEQWIDPKALGIGPETVIALYRRCLIAPRSAHVDGNLRAVRPTDAGIRAVRENLSA